MKNENIESAATIAPFSKEQGEKMQAQIATELGCDAEKKISGMDYLVIFLRILEAEGVADKAMRQRGVQIAAAMKANNSALRQWLYERSETAKPSAKLDKYLSMGE